MKLNFDVFGFQFGFLAGVRRKRKEPVAGVTNRTADGYYVPFLDYDEMPLDWIEGELSAMQDEFKLGDFYVFESGAHHYHVVGFDKMTRDGYEQLLARSSCDRDYKKVPFAWGRRVATLRVTDKGGRAIRFLKVVSTGDWNFQRWEQSRAHKLFFEGVYGIEAPEGRYDNYEKLITARYVV